MMSYSTNQTESFEREGATLHYSLNINVKLWKIVHVAKFSKEVSQHEVVTKCNILNLSDETNKTLKLIL